MTNTIETTTTKTNPYYLRALAVLAALALMASLLVVLAAKPAHASTTFTVNSTNDPGDGTCNVNECTLREAIEAANATSGGDTINFNIPGSGIKTISPNSILPDITEALAIDGYSQPGASPNTLAQGTNAVLNIELDGTNAGSSSPGLSIVGASNVVVKGLVINRFGVDGIEIGGASAKDNRVEGNFIGTDPSGTFDLGNGEDGVFIRDASGSVVGGTTPDKRNLISGNGLEGVVILGSSTNKVEGNLIGTQKDGLTALGNDTDGVAINGSNNTVGGTSSASANTIAFNGVGRTPLGGNGVAVVGGTGNRILGNSIFSNVLLAIDLGAIGQNTSGVTPNDVLDPDVGPNDLQNFPVITSAKASRRATTVKGTLNSTPNTTFVVQLFANPKGTDEGKAFIGETSVATDAAGNASFSIRARRVGGAVTATVTNFSSGDTSEFSAPKKVVRKR